MKQQPEKFSFSYSGFKTQDEAEEWLQKQEDWLKVTRPETWKEFTVRSKLRPDHQYGIVAEFSAEWQQI